ncbi:MAG: DUF1116 domain-containing protein, partial [Candidatus Geothermarchaeales archaeon]
IVTSVDDPDRLPEEAEKLAASGEVEYHPNHHHNVVAPMAGVVSPRMPVFVVEDLEHGGETYSNMNEGIGKVLRYGAYGKEVVERLLWMEDALAPALDATIRMIREEEKGLALKPLISQALTMGDDCHNRYVATTSLFLRRIVPHLLKTGLSGDQVREAYRFMAENDFTTLNLGMAAAKAMALAAHGIEYSTIVTVMSRNAIDTGIWVSCLGENWFTADAPVPKGVWFPGYSERDASGDLGDSSITETAGFGGFAMAAAPAIVSWVGGSVDFAVQNTKRTYEITAAEHKHFKIPFLGFRGTPTGVDIRKVVKTGRVPTINTGIAHREAGVGQVGAGIVEFPLELFKQALKAFARKYGV